MNNRSDAPSDEERSGVLESLKPVSGSMGQWEAVIDGQSFLTWPGTCPEDLKDRVQQEITGCGRFQSGTRVRYRTEENRDMTQIPVGRRAAVHVAPPTIKLVSMEL